MKNLDILFASDDNLNITIVKKDYTGLAVKSILLIFILAWMVLLTSCFVGPPRQMRGPTIHEQHGHGGEHRDQDDRHR